MDPDAKIQIATMGTKLEVKVGDDTIYSQTVKASETSISVGNAKGSGTTVAEVNKLIKQFEKTKLAMKKITRNKGMQAKLMSQLAGGNLNGMGDLSSLAGKFKF